MFEEPGESAHIIIIIIGIEHVNDYTMIQFQIRSEFESWPPI